ncbi:MAG: hypothetical protein PHI37_05700 [Candidatus Gracilibacteria bacterium]|nr:hypothetical protein [Candidatus Gracilibacteria bacterium]
MKNDIKSLFGDISLLYKNFVHWNISKLFIFLLGIISGFITIIPFALVFFIFSFFSDISFLTYIGALLNGTYTGSFLGDIIYFLSLGAFILGYFFNFVLLLKLNSSYISGEKLSYKKNEYLNYKLFLRYILLSLLLFIIFLIPILVSIFILGLIIWAFGGIAEVSVMVIDSPQNSFSIISLFIFILLCIVIFYLFYRFIFSYFFILDEDNKSKKLYNIIIYSFHKTSGFKRFLKFLLSMIIVYTIYLPFSIVSTYINGNYEDLNKYASYMNLKQEDKETLKQINSYEYNSLEMKYSGKDLLEIEKSQFRFYYASIIFSIFEFIVIFGVFSMFLTSFYNRNIRQ